MGHIYTKYFQKSKVFLYPLLGIAKGQTYVPVETYICWQDAFDYTDYRFISVYNSIRSTEYIIFEDVVLKQNKMFDSYYKLSNDRHLYIFNIESYKHDFNMFVDGKYSKFSSNAKNKISNYFSSSKGISKNIKSFLYPEEFHSNYAKSLDVDLSIIKEVHEVCSKPDMKKECLIEKIPNEIQLLKDNSISLDKTKPNE